MFHTSSMTLVAHATEAMSDAAYFTVRAKELTVFSALKVEDFNKSLEEFPEDYDVFAAFTAEMVNKEASTIFNIPLFKDCDPGFLNKCNLYLHRRIFFPMQVLGFAFISLWATLLLDSSHLLQYG